MMRAENISDTLLSMRNHLHKLATNPLAFVDHIDWVKLGGVVIIAWLVHYVWRYIGLRMQVRGLPTIHSWVEFFESGARSKLPHIPFLVPVNKYTITDPWQKYDHFHSDLFACTQMTTPHAVYVTSNPQAARMISEKGGAFPKPTEMFRYQAINIFGLQIVSTQTGPEHRRHKGVVRGCFSEEVMDNAWGKMTDAMEVMVREEGLEHGGVIRDVREVLVKVTLLVIGQAGFSIDVPWNIPKTDGDLLPFPEALHTVETTTMTQLLIPKWLLKYAPIPFFQRCYKAQTSLLHHIRTMSTARRKALIEEREVQAMGGEKAKPPTDILGALVSSQMGAEDEARLAGGEVKVAGLTDAEILGNAWIFIVAGHETTAHTLTFALAFLGPRPQLQEDLFQEIQDVCGGAEPRFADLSRLKLHLATCYETVRLRDVVMTLPKKASKDTFIPYTTWDDAGNVTHHTRRVPAGSHVIIDSPACERNPFFWSDPMAFNPHRFISSTGRLEIPPTFTGFSIGQRACIGKRFAEVEMVAFLSHLVRTYKIYGVEAYPGETLEEMDKRLSVGTEELTLTPGKFDVRLERR